LIKFQFHNIQKLQLHQIDEFIALSRAYKGEDVPIKDIKEAVVKAIQVLLNRIGPNDDTALIYLVHTILLKNKKGIIEVFFKVD
jgi:hypothetical protein